MNISGVLVRSRPELVDRVVAALCRLDGVEVHAQTASGKIVVTLEREDAGAAMDTVTAFHDIQGLLSASLIYEQTDDFCE